MLSWPVVFLAILLVWSHIAGANSDDLIFIASDESVGHLQHDAADTVAYEMELVTFDLDDSQINTKKPNGEKLNEKNPKGKSPKDKKPKGKDAKGKNPKSEKTMKETSDVSYEIGGTVFVITTDPGVTGSNNTNILMPAGTVFNISNTVVTVGAQINVTWNYFPLSTTATFAIDGVTFTINEVSGSTTVNAGGTISVRESDSFTLNVNDNITWIVGDQVHADFSSFPISVLLHDQFSTDFGDFELGTLANVVNFTIDGYVVFGVSDSMVLAAATTVVFASARTFQSFPVNMAVSDLVQFDAGGSFRLGTAGASFGSNGSIRLEADEEIVVGDDDATMSFFSARFVSSFPILFVNGDLVSFGPGQTFAVSSTSTSSLQSDGSASITASNAISVGFTVMTFVNTRSVSSFPLGLVSGDAFTVTGGSPTIGTAGAATFEGDGTLSMVSGSSLVSSGSTLLFGNSKTVGSMPIGMQSGDQVTFSTGGPIELAESTANFYSNGGVIYASGSSATVSSTIVTFSSATTISEFSITMQNEDVLVIDSVNVTMQSVTNSKLYSNGFFTLTGGQSVVVGTTVFTPHSNTTVSAFPLTVSSNDQFVLDGASISMGNCTTTSLTSDGYLSVTASDTVIISATTWKPGFATVLSSFPLTLISGDQMVFAEGYLNVIVSNGATINGTGFVFVQQGGIYSI